MKKPTCSTCWHFDPEGICAKDPPVIVLDQNGYIWRQPEVTGDCRCGQHADISGKEVSYCPVEEMGRDL